MTTDESSSARTEPQIGELVYLLHTLRLLDLELRTLDRRAYPPTHAPLAQHLADLIRQRALVCAALPLDLKAQYQRLLARRPAPIAAIQSGHCSGCQLRLPVQMLREAARRTGHLPCPYCQRIVIADDPGAHRAH